MKHTRSVVSADPRWKTLEAIRMKHGFRQYGLGHSAKGWSKGLLDNREELLSKLNGTASEEIRGALRRSNEWPRNAPLLNFLKKKYVAIGFDWNPVERRHPHDPSRTQRWVEFQNYPTIAGRALTLVDLLLVENISDIDDYEQRVLLTKIPIGSTAGFTPRREIMNSIGIGYKGLEGVSWLPGKDPFVLPASMEADLVKLGDAVFLLFDAVRDLFGKDEQLTRLLSHKAPNKIHRIMEGGSVDLIRPDISIVDDGVASPAYRFVITEFESCPAGHGIVHAMQAGYSLPETMLDRFIEYLAGRPYVVFATHEFIGDLFDQVAFCRALRARGVDARILFDRPMSYLYDIVKPSSGHPLAWVPRKDLPAHLLPTWNADIMVRLERLGAHAFVDGVTDLPRDMGNAVVYRFGYFDNYDDATFAVLKEWEDRGATVVNPRQFCLESKVLLATPWLPAVERWIASRSEETLCLLQRSIAETRLLSRDFMDVDEILRDQSFWVTKYAAWDGGNESWGARSVLCGEDMTGVTWQESVSSRLTLPFPVVAQHFIRSVRLDVPYVDENDRVQIRRRCATRLTPFLLRGSGGAVHAGSAITLRANTNKVHGATDAIETPVVFRD